MSVGRNWMLYVVIAVVVVAAAFFVWRQMQPAGGQVAESSGAVAMAAANPAAEAPSTLPQSGLIGPQQYQSEFAEAGTPHLLVDVRTPQEFNSGYIEGAVNIPLQNLTQRLDEIPADQPVVLYCRSGNRSSTAARMLTNAGYDQVYDLGGVIDWQAQGLPLQ